MPSQNERDGMMSRQMRDIMKLAKSQDPEVPPDDIPPRETKPSLSGLVRRIELKSERLAELCGEILATLKLNIKKGTLQGVNPTADVMIDPSDSKYRQPPGKTAQESLEEIVARWEIRFLDA